jgi:hypothetical protein
MKATFDPFVPEMLDNLVWWTNTIKAARDADEAAQEAA